MGRLEAPHAVLQALVLVPAAAAVLLNLQQVEAAKEEDEEHVGDDDDGDGRGVVREFAVRVPRALRELAAAAALSSPPAAAGPRLRTRRTAADAISFSGIIAFVRLIKSFFDN